MSAELLAIGLRLQLSNLHNMQTQGPWLPQCAVIAVLMLLS